MPRPIHHPADLGEKPRPSSAAQPPLQSVPLHVSCGLCSVCDFSWEVWLSSSAWLGSLTVHGRNTATTQQGPILLTG